MVLYLRKLKESCIVFSFSLTTSTLSDRGWDSWMTSPTQWTDMPACVHAKSLQLCPDLCNRMDYSLPGSSVHGILQSRTLKWVTIPFSRGSSRPRDWTHVSYVSCIGKLVLYHWWPLGSPSGHEFEQTLGDSKGHGSPVCCSHKELDLVTEQLWAL